MSAVTLPTAFPIVGIPLFATFCLNMYQSFNVSKHRKISGVKYPNLYATDAEAAADSKKMIFNCAQRAHANTLESAPYILALFGYLSVFHPKLSSASLMVWVAGRYWYTSGYSTGNPANRLSKLSMISYVGVLALFCGTLGVSVQKTYELFN